MQKMSHLFLLNKLITFYSSNRVTQQHQSEKEALLPAAIAEEDYHFHVAVSFSWHL